MGEIHQGRSVTKRTTGTGMKPIKPELVLWGPRRAVIPFFPPPHPPRAGEIINLTNNASRSTRDRGRGCIREHPPASSRDTLSIPRKPSRPAHQRLPGRRCRPSPGSHQAFYEISVPGTQAERSQRIGGRYRPRGTKGGIQAAFSVTAHSRKPRFEKA